MKAPFIIQELVTEIIGSLDPYKSYCNLLKFSEREVQVKDYRLPIMNDLFIFGVGKSSSFELNALLELLNKSKLSSHLKAVYGITKDGHTVDKDFKQWEGSHPLVSKRNIENSKEFVEKLKEIKPQDSLIFLTSGGASSLLEIPNEDLSFEDLVLEHQKLLNSGLNINEMNRRRKSLSQVKGGGLLNFIATDNILQLVTCDIPNENLSDVGSGPLMGKTKEVVTFKTQSASLLLESLCSEGRRCSLGVFDGQLNDLLDELEKYKFEENIIYVGGGEATVCVDSQGGLGGRNTHFVLSMAQRLYTNIENRNLKICSIGTDGGDGPTDAAGAYIDYNLFESLDCTEYLKNFDSYHYFKKIGTLIKTGPTKTNVMDIRMIWRG